MGSVIGSKVFKRSVASALVATALGQSTPSHAWVLLSALTDTNIVNRSRHSYYYNEDMRSFAFFCLALVITIPFCLLDNNEQPIGLDQDHLRQNGYSEVEIKTISEDFVRLNQILRSRNQRLMPSSLQTRNDLNGLSSTIRSLMPQASPVFISWVFEQAGHRN